MSKAPPSKYKYLTGAVAQATDTLRGVAQGSVAPESSVIKANASLIAIPWKLSGAVAVVPTSQKGSIGEDLPLIIAEDAVNEIALNPFQETVLATAHQGGSVRLWNVPAEGLTQNIETPVATLERGTGKRMIVVDFHPSASEVLVTASTDEVLVWDLNKGDVRLEFPKVYKGQVTSVSWSHDGAHAVTASKDKFLRIIDPRANAVASEVIAHQGSKGWRALWLGDKERIASAGFTKTAERELVLWDPRSLGKPLQTEKLDTSSASPLPFYDHDTNVLYFGSKGETTIKLYEVQDNLTFVGDFKSKDPTAGLALLPKSTVDVMKCEVAKFVKLTPMGQLIPISFTVPRQNMNFFYEELFPNTWDGQAATAGEDWFSGQNGERKLKSLRPAGF